MIRLRSTKLLSGVSAFAILAAFGAVDPVLADQTVNGPGLFPAITNAGADDFILVDTNAVININGSGHSIINSGTLTNATDAIDINAAVLLGNIWNSGTINSTGEDGIQLQANAVVVGGIVNSGFILGGAGAGDAAIKVDTSDLIGGITNSGAASQIAGNTGIAFTGNSVIAGGITNAGTIVGTAGGGIDFQDADIDFTGNITNASTGTISSVGAANAGIDLGAFDTFTGNIANSGLISNTSSGFGIYLAAGTITGNITNAATTGTISTGADGTAIRLFSGTIDGSITNSGLMTGGDFGINDVGALITGEIQNNAGATISAIDAAGVAIALSGAAGTITNGIDNAGQILATAAGGIGISISDGSFDGGIDNASTGTISADASAIAVSIATFDGGITNAGTIVSASSDAIHITSATAFNGGISNSSTGLIQGDDNAISTAGLLFDGDLTNAGDIVGANTAVLIASTTFTGTITNSAGGLIDAASGHALSITSTTVTGNITNAGTLEAEDDGIRIAVGTTMTGDLLNSGSINADSNGGGTGIGINILGTITGTLTNTGLIDPVTGINVGGVITGGIFNSNGVIIGTDNGINLSGADAAHTITQTGDDALIQGGEGGEGAAINMNNAFVDRFNANGGSVIGNIVASAGDDMIMDGSGTFAWISGVGTTIDEFNVTDGVAVLGAEARGDDAGAGVTVGAVSMDVSLGRVYLDDDTTITLSGALDTSGGEGTIEWFLTPDNSNYGVINAATADLGAATTAAVFIDPETFAIEAMLAGVPGAITYADAINSVGALAGAFSNSTTITTSSLFFEGTAEEDAGNNIDLVIRRNSFATVLTDSGATETENQNATGGALEAIYLGGEGSSQFEDLFIALFTEGVTAEDIQATYDELAGAEHAQLQGATLRTSQIFNEALGMRLDQTLPTSTGTGFADLGGSQYAQAATSASDAMGAGGGGSHGLTRGQSGASIWLRGFGQWANVDTDPNAAGYDQDTTGVVGGVDYAVSNNATVGVAGSWSQDDIDFDTAGDTAEVDSWQAGAYGSYGFGRFYADGLVSYASHDVDAIRTISAPVPNAPFSALSSYNSTTWSVDGELGMIWRLGRVNLQPSAGLAYSNLSTDGFAETGDANAYELIVEGADADTFASTLALRASGQWMMGRTQVVPDIRLGWRHEFESDPTSFSAVFNETNSPVFQIVSSEIQQDSAVLRAGLTAGLTRNFEVFFNVDGQYNSNASATNASGGVRLTW